MMDIFVYRPKLAIVLYPSSLEMRFSVGVKNALGKANDFRFSHSKSKSFNAA